MANTPLTVLFLCTGNSARSIMAEALLNHLGQGRFQAYSAGSQPAGQVNPIALETLQAVGIKTEGLRSKSWNEFVTARAPDLDAVITLCGNAEKETCPAWYSTPVQVHWGFPDPAEATLSQADRLNRFRRVFTGLDQQIRRLVALPVEDFIGKTLTSQLKAIAPKN